MAAEVVFDGVTCELSGRRVIEGLSMQLAAGERLAVLGRSGAGKTTILRLINGLLTPAAGHVAVAGKPVSEWDSVRLKRSTGYVVQEGGLFPHYTVAENVGLVPRLEGWSRTDVDARVRELLDSVGLGEAGIALRYPRELSGGQRQRVGVARALAARP